MRVFTSLEVPARHLGFMAGRYAKDIIVVETAFTPYPADYHREIDRLVRERPGL